MFPQSPFGGFGQQPPAPTGGAGGMTSNQVQQPMAPGQQAQPPALGQVPQGQGMQPGMPQTMVGGGGAGQAQGMQGIDPRQLAMLRAMLMQRQQPQSPQQMPQQNNLRAMLGL